MVPITAQRPLNRADKIAGIAKGLAVLESFDTERQRLNATLAAERAGLSRAAARRHLLTLEHLGYLESDGAYFWLAPRVLRVAGSYFASARLPRLVRPTLARLSAVLRAPTSVAVLDGAEVVIVAASGAELSAAAAGLTAPRLLAYGLHLGARLPAHATSTGRVLLAALGDAELRRWLASHPIARLTPRTLTARKEWLGAVAQARAQDWCLSSEEHELGVHALAVPLRGAHGRTLAALNVIASPAQLTAGELHREALPRLLEAAGQLRELL